MLAHKIGSTVTRQQVGGPIYGLHAPTGPLEYGCSYGRAGGELRLHHRFRTRRCPIFGFSFSLPLVPLSCAAQAARSTTLSTATSMPK